MFIILSCESFIACWASSSDGIIPLYPSYTTGVPMFFFLWLLIRSHAFQEKGDWKHLGPDIYECIRKKCRRLWNGRKLQLWLLFCYLILVKACNSIRPLVTKQWNATTQVCNLLNRWGLSVLDNCVPLEQQCWALQWQQLSGLYRECWMKWIFKIGSMKLSLNWWVLTGYCDLKRGNKRKWLLWIGQS